MGSILMSHLVSNQNLQYSPVINCPKQELPYRIEIVQHLAKFEMTQEWLNDNVLFQEDIFKPEALNDIESVSMVDFNELNPPLSKLLGNKVHHIIDHHVDNGLYSETLKSKEIDLIGSAATLVVNKLKNKITFDYDLAMFASAPILLDSYNFNEQLFGSKWT